MLPNRWRSTSKKRGGGQGVEGGGEGEAGPASVYAARAPHKEEWNANARLVVHIFAQL